MEMWTQFQPLQDSNPWHPHVSPVPKPDRPVVNWKICFWFLSFRTTPFLPPLIWLWKMILFFVSQLSRKKSFHSSSTYAPFCPDKCGALSLKDYQSLQTQEQCVQVLKECGFNDEEIQFKLEQEGHLPKVRAFLLSNGYWWWSMFTFSLWNSLSSLLT